MNVRKFNPVWFFDATGLIHRKINRQAKPFFYSIVCHDTVKKSIIPVAEFVTTSNSQNTISQYLLEIKESLSNKALPDIIVTDMGWALIYAVLKIFNNCDMLSYLHSCFEFLFNNKDSKLEKIIFYTCSTHFLKNIIRKAKGK